MDIEKTLDGTMVRTIRLAEETHAQLEKYPDGSPEKMGTVPHQAGQFDGDVLRKTATSRIPGTAGVLRVTGSGDGWNIEIMDRDGAAIYSCGPGEFDLPVASAVVPRLPDPAAPA